MTSNEGLNFGQDRMWCHDGQLLRAIARTSMQNAGSCTQLRATSRRPISADMDEPALIDLGKLKADMAAATERMSARKFSLAATNGKNPDFYRNFINNGRDRRMSAEVYAGIVMALGKSADEYIQGIHRSASLPNATVLTSTFAILLDSLGIDPYEDARAQKLAAQFRDALTRTEALHAQTIDDLSLPPAGEAPAGDEDQPST